MHPETRVGVAIPAYNRERLLAATLRSVLEQSHPVTDVVVVDDGSTDGTVAVAVEAGLPVRVVRRPHAGPGATRSLAMSQVQGDVLMPLDADDLLTARSIECRIAVLRSRPQTDVVFGHERRFSACGADGPVALDEPHPAYVPNAMLIRRSAYERVGPFAPDLRVAETLDWMLRARETGLNEVIVPDQVVWRRIHDANSSLIERESFGELAQVLKTSLDRRRTRRT
jgi:glycosyltransferase involved in cell wall biosynthesis